MAKNERTGFSIGDGFRLGIGFAVANMVVAALGAVLWFVLLAGLFVSSGVQAAGR